MDGNSVIIVRTAGELAHVIDSANGGAPPAAVELRADITVMDALPIIEADLTIQGNGHTIDGNGISNTFEVGEGGSLDFTYINFVNGKEDMNQVISNTGEVHFTNCVFDSRSAESLGSITIYNTLALPWERTPPSAMKRGEMSLTNCTFLGDLRRELGVRLENLGCLSLAYCTFDESTDGRFSVIFNGHDLSASHCVFANNTGAGAGVAIANEGSVELSDCMLANNVATEWGGGALFNDNGDMRLNRCSLLGNSASGGGAILNSKAELTLENCSLMGNSGESEGGAIRSGGGYLALSNCTIARNRAEKGSGLFAYGGDVRLTHVTIVNNSAEIGGGVFLVDKGHSAGTGLRNSILAGNRGGDYIGCFDYSVGNLIGDGSCDRSLSGDPMLGQLVEPDDGSPAYFPLLPKSPAINAAHRHFCTETDQIGTRRPYKSYAGDIGAIERVFDA